MDQIALVTSGNTPSGIPKASNSGGSITWFRVADMNPIENSKWMTTGGLKMASETAASLALKLIPAGAIIFPKRGGAIATNKKRRLSFAAACDLNLMAVVPGADVIEYAWVYFQGLDLAKLSDGSNVPQINHPDITLLPFPLPPLEEQVAIAEMVEGINSTVEHIEADIEAKLKGSKALRQSILRQAFSGQLVPQDPEDEPACELLKHIAAEREERARQMKAGRKRRAPRKQAAKTV